MCSYFLSSFEGGRQRICAYNLVLILLIFYRHIHFNVSPLSSQASFHIILVVIPPLSQEMEFSSFLLSVFHGLTLLSVLALPPSLPPSLPSHSSPPSLCLSKDFVDKRLSALIFLILMLQCDSCVRSSRADHARSPTFSSFLSSWSNVSAGCSSTAHHDACHHRPSLPVCLWIGLNWTKLGSTCFFRSSRDKSLKHED